MLVSIFPSHVCLWMCSFQHICEFSPNVAPTETLQLLAELLQSLGWFSDKSPQHKQQNHTSIQLYKRMTCSDADESVHALTGSWFSPQVCELVRFLIENCCSVLGEDVTSLFRSFSQKSSSSDHGSGKNCKTTLLVTETCSKCQLKYLEEEMKQNL